MPEKIKPNTLFLFVNNETLVNISIVKNLREITDDYVNPEHQAELILALLYSATTSDTFDAFAKLIEKDVDDLEILCIEKFGF